MGLVADPRDLLRRTSLTPTPPLKGRGLLVALFVALAITASAHAKPRPPTGFEAALPAPLPVPHPADGSIFNVNAAYAPLTDGRRARMVGDPLTIILIEATTTSKSAGAKTQRSGGFGITPPGAGPLAFLNPDALKASGQASFNGQGNAAQTSSLDGAVAVTITEVRPNGTALVRGEKRMLLSQGQEWIQFAGIVRLADITADNTVASTRVADARIEYAGNGAVQRASREGWLSRFFAMISPF